MYLNRQMLYKGAAGDINDSIVILFDTGFSEIKKAIHRMMNGLKKTGWNYFIPSLAFTRGMMLSDS